MRNPRDMSSFRRQEAEDPAEKKERKKAGIIDTLVRLSVGIEDAEDITQDLKQALAQA